MYAVSFSNSKVFSTAMCGLDMLEVGVAEGTLAQKGGIYGTLEMATTRHCHTELVIGILTNQNYQIHPLKGGDGVDKKGYKGAQQASLM